MDDGKMANDVPKVDSYRASPRKNDQVDDDLIKQTPLKNLKFGNRREYTVEECYEWAMYEKWWRSET